jgi:hypothetical protein
MEHQHEPQGQQTAQADARSTASPVRAPAHPALRLQRAVGNQAVQGLIQANLPVSRPGDADEVEADAAAERIMAASPSVSPPPASSGSGHVSAGDNLMGALGSGSPLESSARAFFEGRFARDLGAVRVHQGAQAAETAKALGASAFTVGRHVVFGEGQHAPDSDAGKKLLAHELTHVVQQTGESGAASRPAAGPKIQRQPSPDPKAQNPPAADPAAKPPVSVDIPLIPPEWAKEPGGNDILTVVSQGRMVALPAAGNFVVLRPPKPAIKPTEPLVSVPTIGKEGMVAVNVGGRIGFQLDAGGEPIVVYPDALAAIRQSLGITTMAGTAITHIHDDHVRAFVATVRNNNIRPEGLFYPAAFATNVNAPGSTFARAIQAVQTDPSLRALGHGSGGQYQTIPTPTGGAFFRTTVPQGQVTFDFYGLTRAFQELQTQRAAGQKQPRADTASLLTRVSFQDSGVRMLYLGDLRGSDLTLFEQAMGPQAYQEMLQGVRVITGFQHHMGALESQADRDGLLRLLRTTYLQTGELDVIVQSAEQYGGRQFLNRSLMSALTGMGVNVHVAKGPQARQVGTITYDSSGKITMAGGGEMESLAGSAEMQAQVRRLIKLNEAAETLGRYGRFVNPQYRYTEDVRKARDDLKAAIDDYMETSMRNVKSGASGRAQSTLDNPAQQAQALQRVRATHPVEEKLLPAYMESLRELNRQGPYREIIETELEAARKTGRMSDKGIEALWEVEPEVAKRLVGESGLPRSVQRQTMAQLPGQPAPVAGRLMAGFMIIVTLAEIAGPMVKSARESSYAENVKKGLVDIIWWQEKGVFPTMEGVNDRWWPRDNEWTTSPQRIQQLLDDDDLDYLVLTGIPDVYWDAFTIWASTHLISYPDWNSFITQSTAVRGTGPNIEELTWSYRKGNVSGETIGFDLSEEWVESQRLTTILRAAAKNMVETTTQQIKDIESKSGPDITPAYQSMQKYHTTAAFAYMRQAQSKKRFKQSIEEPTLYTLYGQQKRTGYSKDSVFYVFSDSEAHEDVPGGYVVVGGADYNTYMYIYNTRNRITVKGMDEYGIERWYAVTRYPNEREVLLAKSEDLEDVPK